jgi:hypothetical protein
VTTRRPQGGFTKLHNLITLVHNLFYAVFIFLEKELCGILCMLPVSLRNRRRTTKPSPNTPSAIYIKKAQALPSISKPRLRYIAPLLRKVIQQLNMRLGFFITAEKG